MNSRIIIACDYQQKEDLFHLVDKINPKLCRLKIGKGMFTRFGPLLVKELIAHGFDIFLDLKFHDIPSTVYDAVCAARDLGVWMTNVHALGGRKMLEASLRASESSDLLLIAVTILTSFDDNELKEINISGSVTETVLSLASLTHHVGLDGVVCSALEVEYIKAQTSHEFLSVTPGIRLVGDSLDCQKRVVTPKEARGHGSDYLVIGRSITNAKDPNQTLIEINQQISA